MKMAADRILVPDDTPIEVFGNKESKIDKPRNLFLGNKSVILKTYSLFTTNIHTLSGSVCINRYVSFIISKTFFR